MTDKITIDVTRWDIKDLKRLLSMLTAKGNFDDAQAVLIILSKKQKEQRERLAKLKQARNDKKSKVDERKHAHEDYEKL